MSKALGTNAAMPAPSGVSYRGRWGLVRYGPFALPSYHFGRGTMAANFLILLTAAEAAKRLRVSPWTIYRLARIGKLPSYRAGSALRFTVDEIERFEKESGAVPARKAAPPFPGIFRHHG